MLNQIVLVGRLTKDPEIKKLESGKCVSEITIAVPRSFKNEEGIYETDFISCNLWNETAQHASEYCRKGDIIGVKGRLQMDKYEDKEGNNKSVLKVQAEKVTYLSSVKDKNHDDHER